MTDRSTRLHHGSHRDAIADLAVAALRAEADLTPKPGLVDRRGSGAHADMDLAMLHASAESLRTRVRRVRLGGNTIGCRDTELRAAIGVIGRAGEAGHAGGHRRRQHPPRRAVGAGPAERRAAAHGDVDERRRRRRAAGRDPRPRTVDPRPTSHGARVRRRYGCPARRARRRPASRTSPACAARAARRPSRRRRRGDRPGWTRCWPDGPPRRHLRAAPRRPRRDCAPSGGRAGRARCRRDAARRRAGGTSPRSTDLCLTRRLSPGGSGDLLSATLFLDALDERTAAPCKP